LRRYLDILEESPIQLRTRSRTTSDASDRRRAVVVGKFDGVHRGHQLLLSELEREARVRGLAFGAIAFYPDPIAVLYPERQVRSLMPLAERVERLLDLGLDFVISWNFTTDLASLTAREFFQLLHDCLDVSLVLMGPSHRIGCDRVSMRDAVRLASEVGIEVVGLHETASYDRESISSSAIRSDVCSGLLERATEKLSRPFCVIGSADTIGESHNVDGSAAIDFAHADSLILPPDGKYLGWLVVGGTGYMTSVTVIDQNIGQMRTHSIDGDLVGQAAKFYFLRPFPSGQ